MDVLVALNCVINTRRGTFILTEVPVVQMCHDGSNRVMNAARLKLCFVLEVTELGMVLLPPLKDKCKL